MILKTLSRLGRLRKITTVVAKHGLGHYLDRRSADRHDTPLDEAHAAERFRSLLEELGPTFVKFGQVLSTRPDVLPPTFVTALSELQDHCSPMKIDEVEQVFKNGLGKPVSEIFFSFEPVALATGSIAQVHRAKLHDGREVAVKIQRPNIHEQVLSDLDLLHVLAQLAESIIEESGIVTARGVVEEFEQALREELNFEHEAKMMRRFRACAETEERDYFVPDVYPEYSSRTVLTMELAHGRRLAEVREPEERAELAKALVRSAFQQVFLDGVFHADPHPGNFLWSEDGKVVLLDFGAVGQISYAMRETLVVLVISIGMRDADTVARLLYRAGIPDERIILHQLRDACASLLDEYLGERRNLYEVDAAQLLSELFEMASQFRIRIPSEYALISRASVTVEGILRQIDPSLEILQAAQPYITSLVEEQFSVRNVRDSALVGMLRARSVMHELPLMLSQVAMDLESGKFKLQLDSPKLEQVARNVDGLGLTIFVAAIAGSLVSGSIFLLGQQMNSSLYGVPVVPALGIFTASILFGATLGRYWVAPRIKKISVQKVRERWRRRR